MNPASSAGDIGNALVGVGGLGLEYYNAVANNVFPSGSIATTPSGPAAILGTTNTSTIFAVVLAIIAGVAILYLLRRA